MIIRNYIGFSFFLILVNPNIIMPKISIEIPDHKLIFMPNDFVYIAIFDAVYKPYIVNSIPNTVNINPIGIFISNIFLVFNFELLVFTKIVLLILLQLQVQKWLMLLNVYTI